MYLKRNFKNTFTERVVLLKDLLAKTKNLAGYGFGLMENYFPLDQKNNYVGRSIWTPEDQDFLQHC